MKHICYFIIILFQLHFLSSQSIPNYNLLKQSSGIIFDAGLNWEELTNFKPIGYKKLIDKQQIGEFSKNFIGQLGLSKSIDDFSLYGFSIFRYKKYFYAYSYPTYTNNIVNNYLDKNLRNLNIPQDDNSGIGFENSWANIQIGRGKESWGAGNDIELALSENSNPYQYFLLSSDYGKIRVRYIHGFLENIDGNVNRYINARGIEWTNQRSLIIGFSETIIYSGENRSIDIGYINPMASHLEIELNDRLNVIGASNANAVWQMHLDYLLNKRIRLSFNYLFDEYVIDEIQKEKGKEHGKAFSIRLACTPINLSKYIIAMHSSIIHVGTPTFRHGLGTNNFVQNRKPLGWYRGSDGQEINVGLKFYNKKDIIASINYGLIQSGEENIIYRSYETYKDYIKGPFPSGKVNETIFTDASLIYWKKYLIYYTGLHWSKNIKGESKLEYTFGIRIYHTFSSKFF